MPHTDSPDTRLRLLEAAADLIWQRSFQATGVDELCARAKAKKGSFYHFFPSKSALAVAAIENFWHQAKTTIFDEVFAIGTGLDQIRTLIKRIHAFQTTVGAEQGTFPGCPFGSLGQEMAKQDEQIRSALQKIFDEHCDYLETALVQAVQTGEIPAGDNRTRARNIFALLEGGLLQAKVANDPQVFLNVLPAVEKVAAS